MNRLHYKGFDARVQYCAKTRTYSGICIIGMHEVIFLFEQVQQAKKIFAQAVESYLSYKIEKYLGLS